MADINSITDATFKERSEKEKPAWFTEDVREIPANARKLLEQYSHIVPDQVLPHVVEQVGRMAILRTVSQTAPRAS